MTNWGSIWYCRVAYSNRGLELRLLSVLSFTCSAQDKTVIEDEWMPEILSCRAALPVQESSFVLLILIQLGFLKAHTHLTTKMPLYCLQWLNVFKQLIQLCFLVRLFCFAFSVFLICFFCIALFAWYFDLNSLTS